MPHIWALPLIFYAQENHQHTGIFLVVCCQSFDADVHCLLSAAFGFPMIMKWISVL